MSQYVYAQGLTRSDLSDTRSSSQYKQSNTSEESGVCVPYYISPQNLRDAPPSRVLFLVVSRPTQRSIGGVVIFVFC